MALPKLDHITRHGILCMCTDLLIMSSLVIMAVYIVSRLAHDKGCPALCQHKEEYSDGNYCRLRFAVPV